MAVMALTSKITAYDPNWPSLYQSEAIRLRQAFGHALLEIHHIGSTAVTGLAAKPEIDILILVKDSDVAENMTAALVDLGYRRGGDLSAGHSFFKRDVDGVRTHKLHLCLAGHAKAIEMLKFRDHLRQDNEVRDAYGRLKLQLEQENTKGISEYLRGKEPYIQCIVDGL
jgi:GrpB-like predicted nucleotidyltransferase (UPF0157 family)